jgi:hypothetical protein
LDPYYAQLLGAGFSPPTLIEKTYYFPPLLVRAGPGGLFAISSGGPDLDFYTLGNEVKWSAYEGGVADPLGHYVARAQAGELRIFRTGVDSSASGPWISIPGCGRLLAWAKDRERMACVTNQPDGGASGSAWIIDLDGSPAPRLTAQDVRNHYNYSESDAVERRRAFSRSGAWFAFTTNSALYVADLKGAPWALPPYPVLLNAESDSPFSELAFSPDEHRLLWYRGSKLSFVNLENVGSWFASLTFDPLRVPARCQEDFVNGPDNWCGNVDNTGLVVWAPDSRFAAAMTTTGILRIWDFGLGGVSFEPIDACRQGCASDFSFQP